MMLSKAHLDVDSDVTRILGSPSAHVVSIADCYACEVTCANLFETVHFHMERQPPGVGCVLHTPVLWGNNVDVHLPNTESCKTRWTADQVLEKLLAHAVTWKTFQKHFS